jgi:hypothetical protein
VSVWRFLIWTALENQSSILASFERQLRQSVGHQEMIQKILDSTFQAISGNVLIKAIGLLLMPPQR